MSDPVVEELLEKGARAAWDSDSPMASWEQVPPKLQAGYRSQVSAAFDAVFPGWREGITRELSARHGDQRFHAGDAVNARYCAGNCCSGCVLESRLVVHGPWVPVEEGTDG